MTVSRGSASGEDILEGIRAAQKHRHDTLYCNDYYERKLLSMMNGNSTTLRQADNVQIYGLQVVTHERFEHPIVCEKGDIFDHARDWKDGDGEYYER